MNSAVRTEVTQRRKKNSRIGNSFGCYSVQFEIVCFESDTALIDILFLVATVILTFSSGSLDVASP